LRQVGQYRDRVGAEMMFDAFDVLTLCLGVEAEERKKSRKGGVPILNLSGDVSAFIGQQQAAILFLLKKSGIRQLLHHAGDRGLLDFERRCDVHHTGVALGLNQFMDALQVILGALAW
jgi:hypothetical protein